MKKEIWKFINQNYQISNYGNFRRVYEDKIRNIRTYENTRGYLKVRIYEHSKYKQKTVHRLVAETFIPNPKNLPCVNHIDGNKHNNMVENLEWCTYKYNSIHAMKNGLLKNNINYAIESIKKPVNQYDKKGNYIKKWESIINASKELKINPSGISATCKGKRKSAGGYKWKYVNKNTMD